MIKRQLIKWKMIKKINTNKTVITAVGLGITQLVMLSGVILYYFIRQDFEFRLDINSETLFMLVLVIVAFLNSFIAIRYLYINYRVRFQYEMLKDSLNQVENLNKTLRAQRHDFMNHLQVIYSLMELEDYEEASDYIERVYGDIKKVSKVMKTSSPAINALIQAKTLECENKGITIDLDITSQFEKLPIPSWEFCRVLGNLIDNSIYALIELKTEKKLLCIDLYEDIKTYGFRIKDNGTLIPQDICEKIFQAGFTTKGNNGEGMGLSIVKEILTKYRGFISVTSAERETSFEGIIPK